MGSTAYNSWFPTLCIDECYWDASRAGETLHETPRKMPSSLTALFSTLAMKVNKGVFFMQNRCPRCNSKMPLGRFLFPFVYWYNNIYDNFYICSECNAYINWTRNRKVALLLANIFCSLYLFIGSNIVSSGWFLKVLLPSVAIPPLILLFFPKQIKVREKKDYSTNTSE